MQIFLRSGLCTLALIAACGGKSGATPDADPTGGDGGQADAGADADLQSVPRIEPANCRYEIGPSLGRADVECGDLVVFENRNEPVATIKVHFLRVRSNAGSPNATIYLEGGPGGNGSGMVARLDLFGAEFLEGLLVDGDFLVIAQRGTSLSIPSLDCDFDCGELEPDLPSYNTAYNADDVDDLRAALGYDKLNVYGISYGSRLGLEVLRRHGDNVRAAVLGGLVPSHIVWPAHSPASFYGALTALDASCADDGGCGAAFGDLRSKFLQGVNTLNDNPVDIDGGTLDGYNYAALLFRMMYARSSYPWLPLMISDLAIRRTDRIEGFLVEAGSFLGNSNISSGLYYSVVCGELFNPPDPNAFDDANAQVPSEYVDLFGGSFYGMIDYCSSWPVGNLQAELALPVTSSVPTLLSSGTIDPITPPSFGDAAAQHLTGDTSVVFENSGHGATLQSPCGWQILFGFLADPATPPDTSCASDITTDYVLPGAVLGTPIPGAEMALELQHAPVPPQLRGRPLPATQN